MIGAPVARVAVVAAFVLLAAGGCVSTQSGHVNTSPAVPIHSFAGGCAGTVLTDAAPPVWAQGGWSVSRGSAWPVPWAFGSAHTSVAFLFSYPLVAASSTSADSSNKILWVSKDALLGVSAAIQGRPLGQSEPVVNLAGGPTVANFVQSGCWTFRLSWTGNGRPQVSTINLTVLPRGSTP